MKFQVFSIKVASFLKFDKKIAVGFKNLRKWGMLDNCSELLCTKFGAFWLKIVSAVNEKSDPSSITVSTKLSLRLKKFSTRQMRIVFRLIHPPSASVERPDR